MDDINKNLNSNVSAQIDLLRKKMIMKLALFREFKKEFTLYCECKNFLANNSTSVAAEGKDGIECDREIFSGALTYVIERMAQFQNSSATNSYSQESSAKNCDNEKGHQTKTEETAKTKCVKKIYLRSIKTEPKPSEDSPAPLESRKLSTKNDADNDENVNVPSISHRTENSVRLADLKKELARLTERNSELKSETKELNDVISHMKKKNEATLNRYDKLEADYQLERSRRKSMETKCATGKCQPTNYENVKNENAMLKEKNTVLHQEIIVLNKKLECQRNALSGLNQAHKRIIEKYKEPRSEGMRLLTEKSSMERKRWLNDKFDDSPFEQVKKRLKICSTSVGASTTFLKKSSENASTNVDIKKNPDELNGKFDDSPFEQVKKRLKISSTSTGASTTCLKKSSENASANVEIKKNPDELSAETSTAVKKNEDETKV